MSRIRFPSKLVFGLLSGAIAATASAALRADNPPVPPAMPATPVEMRRWHRRRRRSSKGPPSLSTAERCSSAKKG
jgi:hypothetical protein